MKRRRKSKTRHTTQRQQESTEEGGEEEEEGGFRASMADLPIPILTDILSRLSVKSIFRSRSVSKLWLNILLSHDFAKLHFSRASTCPLLHNPNGKCISTALYLLEIERDRLCYVCDDDNNRHRRRRRSDKLCASICDCHGSDGHVNMKISTRFMLLNLEESSSQLVKLKDRHFNVVNSCNGLLCLRGYFYKDPVVIYNPVTGEYSFIPTPGVDALTIGMDIGGLGFCPKTNKYKVLLMLYVWIANPDTGRFFYTSVALVYTLGDSGTWRRMGDAPMNLSGETFPNPTYLNGALHWFVSDYRNNNLIVYFDFKDEKFRIMLFPHHFCPRLELNKLDKGLKYIDQYCSAFSPSLSGISMGVLRDRLCICDASPFPVHIWVMKDYGVQESWFEELRIEKRSIQNLPAGLYQPIGFLNNGELLIYQANNTLISYNGHDIRYFKIHGFQSKFKAIPHVPSFLSLTEVMGDEMEVLNVKSRLVNSELREGNAKALSLVEEKQS